MRVTFTCPWEQLKKQNLDTRVTSLYMWYSGRVDDRGTSVLAPLSWVFLGEFVQVVFLGVGGRVNTLLGSSLCTEIHKSVMDLPCFHGRHLRGLALSYGTSRKSQNCMENRRFSARVFASQVSRRCSAVVKTRSLTVFRCVF